MLPKLKFTSKLKKLLTLQESGLPSTEIPKATGAISGQTLPQESQLQGTWHRNCNTLTYGIYLEIVLSCDLRLLIISGEVSEADLKEAWNAILNEYSSYIKTDKSDSIFNCWKKLEYTRWKMNMVRLCIEGLKIKYSPTIAEELMKLGYDYIDGTEDNEAYFKKLYDIQTEAKNLIVYYNQYLAEYTKLCPEGAMENSIPQRDRMSYEKELRVLSKFMGYGIRKDEISVVEFCSIINTYLESTKKKD